MTTGEPETQADHDTYVYQEGRRWRWRCPCGINSTQSFARRMDADEDVWSHLDQFAHP